jgi:hypothetical protein
MSALMLSVRDRHRQELAVWSLSPSSIDLTMRSHSLGALSRF